MQRVPQHCKDDILFQCKKYPSLREMSLGKAIVMLLLHRKCQILWRILQLWCPSYYSSHDSPYYLPHRGGCVCYSGDFICAKEDYTKAFRKDEVPVGMRKLTWLHKMPDFYLLCILAPKPLEGVYLFLGYSRKDARVVLEGRKEVKQFKKKSFKNFV